MKVQTLQSKSEVSHFPCHSRSIAKGVQKKTALEKNTSSFNLVFYELESKFKLDLVTEEDDTKKAN